MLSGLVRVPVYVILACFTAVSLVPFYIMLIMGTYKNEEIFTGFLKVERTLDAIEGILYFFHP